MIERLKRSARELMRDRPGMRFRNYHRRRRDSQMHPVRRTLYYVLAALLLLIGVALSVLPGPAFVFFILAFAILAARSRRVAVLLDRAEIQGWRIVNKFRARSDL